jgi:hypothetical protein
VYLFIACTGRDGGGVDGRQMVEEWKEWKTGRAAGRAGGVPVYVCVRVCRVPLLYGVEC